MIIIEMNNGGRITLELDEKAAPKTVANFRKLVNEGFKQLMRDPYWKELQKKYMNK